MKKIVTLMLALSFAFALTACTNDTTTTTTGDGTTTTSDPIKLGVIGPLTGEYSMYGIAVENGALLAAAELNAAR